MIKRSLNIYVCLVGLSMFFCFSCKKLINIPEPITTTTTTKIFSNDSQASSAMAGVFTQLINGIDGASQGHSGFSTGLSTLLGSLCADELTYYNQGPGWYIYNTNKLLVEDSYSYTIWVTTYNSIYGANDIIEGIQASTSSKLTASVRTRLTGEAKFVRAFSYFYLVNFFGDVPLALTVDFNKTGNMTRIPKAEVYKQIIKDLIDAKSALGADFASSKTGERIRPNKWAATALLARTYLYTGAYAEAAAQATEVIAQSGLFQLKTDLNDVFLMNSTEAIWQLQQNPSFEPHRNATPEAYTLLPNIATVGEYPFRISDQLNPVFELKDKRKTDWQMSRVVNGKTLYYPYKYKIGMDNSTVGNITEYYMVLRLAEQYLIRAEASVLGSSQLDLAIADLNVIRHRAGLDDLPATLSRDEVIAAIEKERRAELFAEWGHRWFDLKRTGRAHDVLSVIPIKQPWRGDYQLLFPIPPSEILNNHNLSQNPVY
ncbi:SusD family protein [Pedobacter sp. ok626]|nr:SusD family protein [Pedobacter sp. ok626]